MCRLATPTLTLINRTCQTSLSYHTRSIHVVANDFSIIKGDQELFHFPVINYL